MVSGSTVLLTFEDLRSLLSIDQTADMCREITDEVSFKEGQESVKS